MFKFFGNKSPEDQLSSLVEKLFEKNYSFKATVKILKFLLKNEWCVKRFIQQQKKFCFSVNILDGAFAIEISCEHKLHEYLGFYDNFKFLVKSSLSGINQIQLFIPEINYYSTREVGISLTKYRGCKECKEIPSGLSLSVGDLVILLYNKLSAKS